MQQHILVSSKVKIHKARASTFSRTELLAYRTKSCYIGTPKISSFRQKLFDLPKIRKKLFTH